MLIIDKYPTIARLRSSIRSQEALSRGLRTQINALRAEGPSTGQERCNLHVRKQAIGRTTRTLLLAIAMVRGRACRTQEARARVDVPCFDVARVILDLVVVDPVTCRQLPAWETVIAASLKVGLWVEGGAACIEAPVETAVAA